MFPELEPFDEQNQKLKDHVRPESWTNPTPSGRYNMVVIGGGTAGLVTAAIAAGLGAKTALIESKLLGGDCLNVGCVPSKALIHSSRMVHEARKTLKSGYMQETLPATNLQFDFGQTMQRMRNVRASIAPHDSAQRFKQLGVDVYFGQARFQSTHTVEVAGQTLQFRKACIAAGTAPFVPPIEGLAEAGFLTNETIFSLTELPQRIAVIGGGPIGCELAQCFQRLGAQVSILERSGQILPNEDQTAAQIVSDSLRSDGVQVLTNFQLTQVRQTTDGKQLAGKVQVESSQVESSLAAPTIVVDEILVATGRRPQVANLGLEKANIEFDPNRGITVNDALRTTNRNVYAAGDVATGQRFTHAADFMARIVAQNALSPGFKKKFSRLVIPRSIYTSPEIAQVGLHAAEAEKQNYAYDSYEVDLRDNDRSVLQDDCIGTVKAITKKGSDQILGATLVGSHASELIGYFSVAMTNRLGLSQLGNSIVPYPTVSDAVRRLGDLYSKTKLTPFKKSLLTKWFSWFR